MIRKPPEMSGPMNKAEAKALTERIRKAVDGLWELLLDAHERKAWKALGYGAWEEYVKAEFGFSKQRSYQLLDQGRVVRAISEATGGKSTTVDLSERDARDIKPDLPAVAEDIKQRVERGEDPKAAVADVIKAKRDEKAKAKPEKKPAPDHSAFHDQQADALPQAVKDQQQATAEWRTKSAQARAEASSAERITDLDDEIENLKEVILTLNADNKKFEAMRVQFEQGGFAAVIAGKDEEIRVLEGRLYQESADKAGWAKKSKTWMKRALDLGWSGDLVIPLDNSDDEVIQIDV